MSPSRLVIFLECSVDCAKELWICVEFQVLWKQLFKLFFVSVFQKEIKMSILYLVDKLNALKLRQIILFAFIKCILYLCYLIINQTGTPYCIIQLPVCLLVIYCILVIVSLKLRTVLYVVNCTLEVFLGALHVVELYLVF